MSWGQFGVASWNFVNTLTRTAAWAVSTTISSITYAISVGTSSIIKISTLNGSSEGTALQLGQTNSLLYYDDASVQIYHRASNTTADVAYTNKSTAANSTVTCVAGGATVLTQAGTNLGVASFKTLPGQLQSITRGTADNTLSYSDYVTGNTKGQANKAVTIYDTDGTTVLCSHTMDYSAGHTFVGNVTVPSLKIKDSGNDHVITLDTASNEAADRTLTIPALGGNKTLALIDLAQTITADKTFSGADLHMGDNNIDFVSTGGDYYPLTVTDENGYVTKIRTTSGLALVTSNAGTLYFGHDTACNIGFRSSPAYIEFNVSGGDRAALDTSDLSLGSNLKYSWSSTGSATGTADTSLARAAAGVIEVGDGSTGSGWLQNTAGRKRLASAVTNITTTFANLTDLTVTLKAGRKYTGHLCLPINGGLAADGVKFDLNGGTATMTSIHYGFESAIGATIGTRTSTALATAINITALADTNDVYIRIPITLVVNAAGTLIPRQAKDSDAAGATLTHRAGGYLWLEDTP